ncbi:hypothetical protein H4R26_004920 [Coemansia thaxteri]|uniref:SWIRM domain-containing protein n=1 Tax=Coemansia thaxteri TaxID=2663907 RepID=A0A9W8EH40_9FUNG|nr:hypothetical protein H4R26_004920 [Coemansia thaxteri]
MSENDDAHSVATSASDLNELADADGQVPASPERHKYQLPAIAASDSDVASTPAQQQAAACDTPASAQDSVGDAEREEGGKEEETPSCSTSPSSNPLLPLKGPADQPSMGSKQPPANEQGAGINEDNSPDQVAATTSDGDNSQPGTPEPESPLSDDHGSLLGEQEHSFDEQMADLTDDALASHSSEDNMPSYRRSGQDFTDEHDVTLIAPPFAKSNVRWNKADPIDVSEKPMADKLAPAESHCCSVLRILPEQYLAIKLTLLREGRSRLPGSFKKRDAQRLCRIDVNKTSKIYEWFVAIGWLPESNGVYHDPASLP